MNSNSLFKFALILFFVSAVNAQDGKDTVYIKTFPDDAYVYVSDSLIGHTPLFLSHSFGKVKLSKPGYLSKDLDLSTYMKGEKIELTYTGKIVQESFFKSTAFKVLIGSLTALGAVTAYFKIKADNKFSDYQFTGDRALLDQTHTYDIISGISFAALQVNFGFLIYYFLKD